MCVDLWRLQELLEEEVEVRMRRAERDEEEHRDLLHHAQTDLQVRSDTRTLSLTHTLDQESLTINT